VPFFTGVVQPINAAGSEAVAGPTGASGKLRVEPEQLDGAIAVFKDALNALDSEVRWASQELYARPLANDAVSNDITDAFNRLGFMNANSAIVAWEGAVQQIRSIVEQLELAKRTVQQADTGNASNFQVP
jgi:hypothetical protein